MSRQAFPRIIGQKVRGMSKTHGYHNVAFWIHIPPIWNLEAPPWSSGSVLDHRLLPPVFESWRGHIWRLFHLWLRFITFGGRSAHLAYHAHKSGHKTSIIIIIYMESQFCFININIANTGHNFSTWHIGKAESSILKIKLRFHICVCDIPVYDLCVSI